MLEEIIRDLRASAEETYALLLENRQGNEILHTETPGNEVVIAYRHTGVLWRCRACPCMEILLPPLEDKVRKGVIKPAAHVPELPVADKDLAIHVPKVF
jgi:hypothetical protein